MVPLKVPSRDQKGFRITGPLYGPYRGSVCVVLQISDPFRVHFIRVPYYFGDLTRDPKLKNYPKRTLRKRQKRQFKGFSIHNLKNCI